jgi:hypothetical protein
VTSWVLLALIIGRRDAIGFGALRPGESWQAAWAHGLGLALDGVSHFIFPDWPDKAFS